MGCREIRMSGSTFAYSSQETATWVFVPTTGIVSLNGMNEFRMQVELISPQGVTVRRAFRKANEENDWQAPQTIGSELTAEGWSYDTTYTSAPVSFRFIQFGVEVKNTSGMDSEACQVQVVVEARVE